MSTTTPNGSKSMNEGRTATEWHAAIKANVERFMRNEIPHSEFSANQAELWAGISADDEVNEKVGQLMLDELRGSRLEAELTRLVVAADQGAAIWPIEDRPAVKRDPMDETVAEHVEGVAEAHGLSDLFSRATSRLEGRTVGGKAFALITIVGDDDEVGDLVEAFDELDKTPDEDGAAPDSGFEIDFAAARHGGPDPFGDDEPDDDEG